ncbi:MAG TPA: hypothetical protein VN622_12495 [Clostridia bacterium]|nr:hypothetical protein [Clostridia bacterium]
MTQSCEANALATEASLPTGSSAAHDSPASFSAGATLSLDTAARLEFSTVDECLETDEGLIGANEKQSNNSQIHRANDRDVSFEADVNIVAAATVAAEQALAHGESSQLEHTTDLEILAPQVAAQLPGDPKARTPNPIVTQSAVAQASSSERARAVVALPKSPDQPPPLCSVATQANDALNNNPANNDSLAKDSTSTVPSVSAEATAGENHDNSRKVRSERRDAQMQPSHSQMQPANTIAEIATVVSTSVGERSTTSAGSAVEHAELLPLHTMVETGTTTNQPKAEITEITSASADLAASRHEARSAQAAAAQELVHAVRLLDRLNHSEMRIGLTTEYGRIDIRTVIRDSHVGATIGIEAGELGSALTAQLPALKEALTSHRLDSTVVVYDAGTGHHAGSQHGNARQHPQATSPVPGIASEDPAAPRDSSRLMTGDSDYGTGLNVTA